MVMMPIVPMARAGARKVVVPPRTSRMWSFMAPDRIRAITEAGSGRYLMVPLGILFVSKAL